TAAFVGFRSLVNLAAIERTSNADHTPCGVEIAPFQRQQFGLANNGPGHKRGHRTVRLLKICENQPHLLWPQDWRALDWSSWRKSDAANGIPRNVLPVDGGCHQHTQRSPNVFQDRPAVTCESVDEALHLRRRHI